MIHPVTIKTPDGVERVLRFTHGAELRIQRKLGRTIASIFLSGNAMEAMQIIHENASMMAYSCLPWEDGNPPVGVSEGTFGEMYSSKEMEDLVASLFECISQGTVKKKDVLATLKEARSAMEEKIRVITGKAPGDSPAPISISKVRRPGRANIAASSGS